jgi:transcriptional regulator with XRE-family HTH domain
MTAKQYRAILDRNGLNQSEVARLFGVHRVTAARWASTGVNGPVEILLLLLDKGKVSVKTIREIT